MILLALLSAIAILIMANFWNLNWFHISPETLQSTKLRSSSRVAVNTDIQGGTYAYSILTCIYFILH